VWWSIDLSLWLYFWRSKPSFGTSMKDVTRAVKRSHTSLNIFVVVESPIMSTDVFFRRDTLSWSITTHGPFLSLDLGSQLSGKLRKRRSAAGQCASPGGRGCNCHSLSVQ